MKKIQSEDKQTKPYIHLEIRRCRSHFPYRTHFTSKHACASDLTDHFCNKRIRRQIYNWIGFFLLEVPLKKDARDEKDGQCADADHTTNGIHQIRSYFFKIWKICKAQKLARARKFAYNFLSKFLPIFWNSCGSLNILLRYVTQKGVGIYMLFFFIAKGGSPHKLGAERALTYFYNNSLLSNSLLLFIEAKCLLYSYLVLRYQTEIICYVVRGV